ncbi:MAG: phosphotransferase [Myxococcales bacterium]|nr:phosphotransferase [Myxococcales bacterium]
MAPKQPTEELVRTVEEHLGRRGIRWRRPHTGLSPAQRFVVTLDDGESVFVKAAVDAQTERWLRTDHLMLSTLAGFVPEVVAWIDAGAHPVLVIEDLHDGHWPADHNPVQWKRGQWELLFETLERVAATPAPASLPSLADLYEPQWSQIAADPEPFMALEICSRGWLERSLEQLVAAEAALDLSGDALVHNDVRSDNVCFRGDRVILVDWSDTRRGSSRHDLANVLSLCQLEQGPEPHAIMPDGGSFAAWHGGILARRALAGDAPKWLTAVFKRGAILCLQWAGRCLDLTPWDGKAWREVR